MRFLMMLVAVLLVSGTMDADADEATVYLGVKGGAYSQSGVAPPGMANLRFRNWAWGAYGGHRFSRQLAAEVEYLALSEDDDEDPDDLDFEGTLFAVSLKPTLSLGQHAELFAKVGWSWLDGKISNDLVGSGSRDAKVSRDGFLAGVGAAWNFSRWSCKLEYQVSEFDFGYKSNVDTELVTLGISYQI